MRGAGETLLPGGVLVTYGPYRRNGQHTAPSNEAFDASLICVIEMGYQEPRKIHSPL
jgi:hypothetical protein